MISSEAPTIIIGRSPLKEIPSRSSKMSASDNMRAKKIANRGASLPVSATTGLTRTIVSATSDPMRDGLGAARVAARLTARGEAVAQARRCDAGGGEELLVIEGDDLRAPLGLEVALEIGRHVDRANGLARSNRP